MSDTQTIRWEQDEDGVVVLVFDDPDQSANTINDAHVASMEQTIERLQNERKGIRGVVLTSAKKTFFAGGDLNDLIAIRKEDTAEFADRVRRIKRQLRDLETLGVPIVAAIGGSALGGGLEIALASHHRIAIDDPRLQIGFPEVTLGLLPGAGGVVRSVRMLGIVPALTELLLEGRRIDPARAEALGVVDQLVTDADELLPAAKEWIAANPEPVQPWDAGGYSIPGGSPLDPDYVPVLQALPASLRKQLRGANFTAPPAILAAAVEGAQVDFDSAIEIEGRYFVSLATGQVAKNMIQAFFFDLQLVNGERGAAGRAPAKARKVVVLGAGMMGAAISYVCARAGLEVVLKDVDLEAARRGKGYSERLVARSVERGSAGEEEGRQLLDRILPTTDAADAAGADVLIEAVFEDPDIKAAVYAEIEPHLADDCLLASNTSTLPITGLAEGVSRPEDFIGLHFFSPVDKMPLLEIISGKATSDATLQRGLDLAKQIRKTPIVVNDSRGFFTSRVIDTFLNEGIAMLGEGIPAPTIEQASAQAGYPAPVLQLSDELNLNLMRRIREETRAAAEAEGREREPHGADLVIDRMLDEFERGGRLAGAGFYEYEEGRRTHLWTGLAGAFDSTTENLPSLRDLEERMLFIEALEAIRCLDEGVIESIADANIGSILGIGYPRWTGGVLQYVNGYEGGLEGFVARARSLATVHGRRFEPPASLVEKAERGEAYADAPLAAARS
jgi:3-hydroxyacyl-CoA dehydrogenase/enoyl-CoA hydratase/3-hydroxybutyryl-CoA epimerase